VANLIAEKTSAKGWSWFSTSQERAVQADRDPLRLGQILINYSNNASSSPSRGEIDISIRVKEQTDKEVVL